MTKVNKQWRFKGYIEINNVCYERDIVMDTWAPSKGKALSNLKYRYCRDHDILPRVRMTNLVGTIERVD